MNKLIVLLFLPIQFFAQGKMGVYDYDTPALPAEMQELHTRGLISLDNPHEILNSTLNELSINTNTNFQLLSVKESPVGKHLSFTQHFDNIPIYQAQIKINLDKERDYQNVIHNLFLEDIDVAFDPSLVNYQNALLEHFIKEQYGNLEMIQIRPYWLIDQLSNKLVQISRAQLFDQAKMIDKELLFSNELLFERPLCAFKPDSIVSGSIFLPDPLTTAEVNYGIPYVDASDSDVPVLNAERYSASVTANYQAGVFSLENDVVNMLDFSLPNAPPATSNDGQFIFTRSESGFEDFNVFFHLTAYQLYIQDLGFTNLNTKINADAHGQNGADNSTFTASTNPPRLNFGDGGVDDAEDADVIIHEYGHALSHDASPFTNSGNERQALDEGYGDYFATSYSRQFSDHNWENMFTWDGHNEFWSGRDAYSNKTYDDLSGTIHQKGEIWVAALMDIYGELGETATDRLVLQSLYGLSSGMNMKQAAWLIIQADSSLNNGANACAIAQHLANRKLIDNFAACGISDITLPQNPAGSFLVYNQEEFAKGNTLSVQVKSSSNRNQITYELMDLSGRLISTARLSSGNNFIKNNNLASGQYLLKLNHTKKVETYKLLVY